MPATAEPLTAVAPARSWNAFVRRWLARPETALFLGLLAVYAATINTRGLYHGSLHQGVVRVLVERGTLYLRQFDPREPLGGDVLVYDGRVYANKQPGSFLLGAGAYRLLRLFGVRYTDDFYLTAALVSLLTSGVLTALTAVLVYRLARDRGAGSPWAIGTALAFGLGSSALAYAGSLHHDVVATACLAGAYAARRRPLLAGVLLGLTLTSSLLPLPMIVTLAAFLVLSPVDADSGIDNRGTRLARSAALLAGLALGAATLLICNWMSFGAPWRMALLTGGHWPESSPRFDPASTIRLLGVYAKLLLWYAPIVIAGILGLAWRAKQNRLLLALVGAQLLFVISLGTDGACQYGPRLLLPIMPFACLGLLSFAGRRWSRAAASALVVIGLASFTINLVGALYGTMFCDVDHWAFAHYLDALRHRVYFSFPLLGIDGQKPY